MAGRQRHRRQLLGIEALQQGRILGRRGAGRGSIEQV
jgi:hypothetical protein